MTSKQLDEEAIFHIARDLSDVAKRETYLDQVCAGDQAIRERVEALLAVHDQEQSFLKSNSPVAATIDQSPVTEKPGHEIGRYKLLQKIGEGGFGVVYMAEQQRPVRRKVALKIIKPGMDTHAVIARFEAERQALAMMDHSNIARVLDGGATDSGRPYFVMELVKGVLLTEYCDKNELSTKQRLELFRTVCQAVQHAHQKGIIHRDLKPSNILVTLHDGQPVVKVIDFGVAKAINQQLTEKTLFTAYGQMVGTPQYMSPEQAEMSGLDVDTRSDVYSLGVVLYELLTGTTPLEADRLRAAGYAELQRLIREDEPPKPSVRLSTSGEQLTVIAKHRSLSPDQLRKTVRGELDWIVMKALEKDRGRRYETPSSFAEDVERYIQDEPVEACPPSSAYLARKFVRRNRAMIAVAISVGCVLLAATAISSWFAINRNAARREAQSQRNEALESERHAQARLREVGSAAYEQAVLASLLHNAARAEAALEIAERAGVREEKLRVLRALIALNRADFKLALQLSEEDLARDKSSVAARAIHALAVLWEGRTGQYVTEGEILMADDLSKNLDGLEHLLVANALRLQAPNVASDHLKMSGSLGNSPIGLFHRAIVRAQQAEDESNPELTRQALGDYERLALMLPENPGISGWRAAAMAHLIQILRFRGELDEPTLENGIVIAKELDNFDNNPFLDYCAAQLSISLGDEATATTALKRCGPKGWFSWFLAADCLRRRDSQSNPANEFEAAVSIRDNPHAKVSLAFLVHDLPGGQKRVGELVTEMLADKNVLNRLFTLQALCLSGDLERVEDEAAIARLKLPHDRFGNQACIDYLADTSHDESSLLEQSPNGYAATQARFTIGLVRLAQKDRDAALEQFRLCRDRVIPGNIAWEMGNAMYVQMVEDPTFPSWLQQDPDRR